MHCIYTRAFAHIRDAVVDASSSLVFSISPARLKDIEGEGASAAIHPFEAVSATGLSISVLFFQLMQETSALTQPL